MAGFRFELRVLLCRSCGGPLPEPGGAAATACAYCGAAAEGARVVGDFSRELRVLVCAHCGGPLPVPIAGGSVTCVHCQTVSRILPRRDASLAPAAPAGGDEAARLERLREQAREPEPPLPPDLKALMVRGGLVDETAEQATALWHAARKEVSAPAPDAGRDAQRVARFFLLTEMLADYHHWKQRDLVARAFLEGVLEELGGESAPGDPGRRRTLQATYCWLARNAAMQGDREAAEAWLALCDPAPDDLAMDNAVRFSRVSLALRAGDHAAMLRELGRASREVPFEGKYAVVANVYRAHALEHVDGPMAGARELCTSPQTVSAWRMRLTAIEAVPEIPLCPASLPIAVRHVAPLRFLSTVVLLPALAGVLLLLDAVAGSILWGGRLQEPRESIVVGCAALFIAAIPGLMLWGRLEVRVHFARVQRARASPES